MAGQAAATIAPDHLMVTIGKGLIHRTTFGERFAYAVGRDTGVFSAEAAFGQLADVGK